MAEIEDYALPEAAPPEPEKKSALDQALENGLPASVDAEKTILGAALLDAQAYNEAAESLEAGDFALDSHQRIFARMGELIDSDQAVDIVTLAEELKRRKELENVGGVAYLASLTEGLPRRFAIAEYVRIVKSKAQMRRLINLCTLAITRAADQSESPTGIIEDVEGDLLEIAGEANAGKPQRIADSVLAAGGVEPYIRRATEPAERDGLKTGYIDFDQKTGGLQKGDLIIIAARPSMGKTSLAINIAQNAALDSGSTVIVFSLEMTRAALEARMLASRARVDIQRAVRGEYLSGMEREKMASALGDLVEDMVFIDDSPFLTITQARAKARRLKQRQGRLDLVIIDYMQLMSAGSRVPSRQEEIASISRGLKAMAKELGCPVMALAQLNRQVEHRTDKRPILADLRECVAGNTLVIDAQNGRMVPVSALQPGSTILAMDAEQKIKAFAVKDQWSTGVKPVFKVTTSSGRSLHCTSNHPFFSWNGWQRLSDLHEGDFVASAMTAPVIGREGGDDLCRLLGYFAGDGTYQRHRAVGFISNDPDTFADVGDVIAMHWPAIKARLKYHEQGYLEADYVRIYENGYGKPHGNPLREWLREIGVFGERDDSKRVPAFVFERGREGARQFLAGYLATDGCVKREQYRNGHGWRVHFDTTSRRLAEDVQCLLQRLSIVSVIDRGRFSKKARRPLYRVTVSQSKPNLLRFAETIPVRGKKRNRLDSAGSWAMGTRVTNPGPFGLPPQLSRHAAIIDPEQKWRDQGRCMGRGVAVQLAERLADPILKKYAESDLLWEKILSIEAAGEEEVFDISVPGANCFVANGLIVHNSGQIEQDADVVAFVHRDAYYRPDDETVQGLADLIIAKQRNGPTGTVKLAYIAELTRFENLAYKR